MTVNVYRINSQVLVESLTENSVYRLKVQALVDKTGSVNYNVSRLTLPVLSVIMPS